MRIALVVDDILCRGPREATEQFYTALREKFACKDPTYLEPDYPIKYVGLDIETYEHRGNRYIAINQQHDVENYLHEIEFDTQTVIKNPMSDKHAISKHNDLLTPERAQRYRSIVGALNYYATTLRYDIAYPASRLSQFSCRPTVGAELALHRVLSYMKCTTDFRICAKVAQSDTVECYSDSDHAGDRIVDCRSQSATMILLNGAPVYWRSVKQPVTSLSSACAEIYALSESVKHMQLYAWRAQEAGVPVTFPVCVQVDNTQAKSFAAGTCVQTKLRGNFDIREKWVQELRDTQKLQVEYVNTTNNLADLLSKCHKTTRYEQLINMIQNKGGSAATKEESTKALLLIATA